MNNQGVAAKMVTSMLRCDSSEFAHLAGQVASDEELRMTVKSELIQAARWNPTGQDIVYRQTSVDVLALLGFAACNDVRHELFDLFNDFFDDQKLQHLAGIDALPRRTQPRAEMLEIHFLESLLRFLLRVVDDSSLAVADEVRTYFAKKWDDKIARWMQVID
jgi:hypothetical protein